MIEQQLQEPASLPALPDGKWIDDLTPDQPACEVASHVLQARLITVCRVLPRAADPEGEDAEPIHQLRIAVRRAVEAVKVFCGLMEATEVENLRDPLRRIRLAADETRNWDVLVERFSRRSCAGVSGKLLEQIKARRREALAPVERIRDEIREGGWEERIGRVVQDVKSHRSRQGRRSFGRQASRYLAPVVRRFLKAARTDLGTTASLHALRIRMKKLRYTMEILAPVFDSAFRKKLYSRVTLFQDILGTVNDHATASALFQDWLSASKDLQERAFLEGFLLMETQVVEDLQMAFRALWTPKVVADLEKRLRAYC